jgi:hypothetical protein
LADNKLAQQAGWDRELLAIEFQGLAEHDFDLELTGFGIPEIDQILADAREASLGGNESDDECPPYSADTTVSCPGDLWLLGNHRVLCGDARDPAAYDQLLEGQKAQFVFTDPPYNVPIDGHVSGLGRIRHKDFAMGCGEMSQPEFEAFLEAVYRLLAVNSADGSIHQICMDWRHMPEMLSAGHRAYTELKNLCVWNKSNAGMGSFYCTAVVCVFPA